jgi:aldehyde dehydrogenase (NAD+)
VAVCCWNFALSVVCGNAVVWKPSDKTPLTGIACEALFRRAVSQFIANAPELLHMLLGGREVGEALVDEKEVRLVSVTVSTRMGREVGPRVAKRFARSILELGGNNAVVLAPSALMDLALGGILFSAVGTAGQRCTTTRRLIVHKSIHATVVDRLRQAYAKVKMGNPLTDGTLLAPIIDESAFNAMQTALSKARHHGGRVHRGERVLTSEFPNAYSVTAAWWRCHLKRQVCRRKPSRLYCTSLVMKASPKQEPFTTLCRKAWHQQYSQTT